MKFTTPCFVSVEDAEKRKELIQWLYEIGGRQFDEDEVSRDCQIVACDDKWFWLADASAVFDEFIDCGTDIELFKALAAMMDGPEITEQYMYATADLLTAKSLSEALLKKPKCVAKKGQLIKAERLSGLYFDSIRKATAEEIIEHFKNKMNNAHQTDSR